MQLMQEKIAWWSLNVGQASGMYKYPTKKENAEMAQ